MATLQVRALIVKDGSRHASARSLAEVRRVFDEVDEIWAQAGIRFVVDVTEWRPEPALIEEVVEVASKRGDDVGRLSQLSGPSPRQITAIYLRSIGGSSGKVFRPKKTVVVTDEAKVSVSRTTAHEIGHLFGLEHWLAHPPPEPSDRSPNQLMARTQPGTELLPADIAVVRQSLSASGLDVS